jgi:hypothetical protein
MRTGIVGDSEEYRRYLHRVFAEQGDLIIEIAAFSREVLSQRFVLDYDTRCRRLGGIHDGLSREIPDTALGNSPVLELPTLPTC